jgi:hypothetical protein
MCNMSATPLQDGTGDFYSLESVTFFIKNIMAGGAAMGQNMGAYVAAAVRSRAQQIILQDRQVGPVKHAGAG